MFLLVRKHDVPNELNFEETYADEESSHAHEPGDAGQHKLHKLDAVDRGRSSPADLLFGTDLKHFVQSNTFRMFASLHSQELFHVQELFNAKNYSAHKNYSKQQALLQEDLSDHLRTLHAVTVAHLDHQGSVLYVSPLSPSRSRPCRAAATSLFPGQLSCACRTPFVGLATRQRSCRATVRPCRATSLLSSRRSPLSGHFALGRATSRPCRETSLSSSQAPSKRPVIVV